MTQKIVLYDTTLRDGTQAEDVNLSTPDKIKIALRLDEFGIDYIEGGWPGSNPVDVAFFKEIANYHLKYARIAAFGPPQATGYSPLKQARQYLSGSETEFSSPSMVR